MTPATSPAESAAHRRALPLQRLIGNGMEWADAHELHARSAALEPWHLAASGIGDRALERAEQALAAGHRRTAQELFLYAGAALRFGQNPLPDGPDKVELYRRMMSCYRRGVELLGGVEHVEIPTAEGLLHGWLHRPADPRANPPVVILLGGFDGWREEYHDTARRIVDVGVAVLMVDGPGQGETRLFGRHYWPHEPAELDDAFRAVVTWTQRAGLGAPAVLGNSMGGYLAARLAACDDRIAAVCVNGGTDRPSELVERFPRFASKVMALYGVDDPVTATALLERHLLSAQELRRIKAPTLILHGEPDQVFLVDSARRVAECIGSTDLTLRIWPDGDHCIYNHTHEKNSLIADWLADRLLAH